MNRYTFNVIVFILNIISLGQRLFMIHGWYTPSPKKDKYYKDLDEEYYLSLGNYSWFTFKYTKHGKRVWVDNAYYTHPTSLREIKITFGTSSNTYTPVDEKEYKVRNDKKIKTSILK